MCSVSASADTVINKSTVCVQFGLKYNNLCAWQMSGKNSLQYITLGHKTTTFFYIQGHEFAHGEPSPARSTTAAAASVNLSSQDAVAITGGTASRAWGGGTASLFACCRQIQSSVQHTCCRTCCCRRCRYDDDVSAQTEANMSTSSALPLRASVGCVREVD